MGTITRGIANNVVTGGKLDGTDGLSGTVSASNIANASLTNITSVSPSLGFAVSSVASDPVSPTEGQIWYNTTSKTLKGYAFVVTNAWASGGNLNTARFGSAGCGTQTAGLAFGGGDPTTTASESYNGTSWTTTPSLNTARNELASSKIGTNTAALGFGGHTGTYPTQIISALTESYNGSAWTSVSILNTARRALGGAGTQTAALGFGGYTAPNTGVTEIWNGTSWTTSPANLNTARRYVDGAGSQTAALAISGSTATATEEWNGSTWTTKNNINIGPARGTGATSSAAIAMGGSPNSSAAIWDGTSWSSIPSLSSGRTDGVAFGTQALAIYAGGYPNIATTEEWTGTNLATRTITVS